MVIQIANVFCHAGAPSEPSLCLPLDPRKETQKRKKIKIRTVEKRNHKFRHSRYEKNLYQCMPDRHALSACVYVYQVVLTLRGSRCRKLPLFAATRQLFSQHLCLGFRRQSPVAEEANHSRELLYSSLQFKHMTAHRWRQPDYFVYVLELRLGLLESPSHGLPRFCYIHDARIRARP